MATLFNTKIKDTYQSLLKLEDNTILTTTTKNVTDGLGNASPLYMSTTRVGIGTNSPTTTLDVNGSAKVSGAVSILNPNYMSLTSNYTLEVGFNVNGKIRMGYVPSVGSVIQGSGNGVVDYLSLQYFGGNVGIGTVADAGYKLDVNGTARFSGAVTSGTNNATFGDIILDYGSGTRKIRPATNTLDLTDSTGTLSGIQVGGFPRIALSYDKFDFVRGLGNFTYSQGSSQNLTLNLNAQAVNHLTPFVDIVAQGYAPSAPSGNNTSLRLYTTNTTSGTYGNIIIGHNGTNATGNVGIGTSSPGALLHVNGTSRFQGQASFGGALEFGNSGAFFQYLTTTSNSYYFGSATGVTAGGNVFARTIVTDNILSGGTGVQYAPLTITGGSYNTFATPSISFITWDGGSQTTRFYINSRTNGGVNGNIVANPDNGNFLIGTTTDSGYKLDVNGTARVNGVLTVGSVPITGTYGAMSFSNNGVGGVAVSFNGQLGLPDPTCFGQQGLHANSSSQVEIKSTSKGFLPPRMTTTQKNAIASPATGLQVFDITMNAMCEYNGTAWRVVSAGKQTINATTGATTIDLSAGNVTDVTLTLSTVITLSNPTVGTYVIKLIQDAIGGKTVSWPFNVLWSGSTPPTLTSTANRTDVITLIYDGVNYYGTYALNF